MSQTTPTIRAWAVVPAGGGQPALCLDRTRAEQIAPAMRGVIVELSSTAPVAPASSLTATQIADEATARYSLPGSSQAFANGALWGALMQIKPPPPTLVPLSEVYIEHHIGPDEGDRTAVLAIVREVEAAHGITS